LEPIIPVLLACLGATYAQTKYWQNSVALWSHAIEVTRKNPLAEYNLGHALEIRGQVGDAVEHYKQALVYYPGMYQAHVNLGCKEYDLGHYVETTNHLIKAVELHPGISIAHLKLAKALIALNADPSAVEMQFAAAAAADPKNANVQSDWGDSLLAQAMLKSNSSASGATEIIRADLESSAEHFAEALRLSYTNQQDQAFMGLGIASKSNGLAAAAHYKAILKIMEVPEALNNLAWLLASHPDPKVRNGAEAVKYAERACEITEYREALLVGTLAAAYAENNQFDEAHKMAEKAIEIAQATGQNELVKKNRELLKLYDSGKPYHEATE